MNQKNLLTGLAEKSIEIPPREPIAISKLRNKSGSFRIAELMHSLREEYPFSLNDMPMSDEETNLFLGLFRWLITQLIDDESITPQVEIIPILCTCSLLNIRSPKFWVELSFVGKLRVDRLQQIKSVLVTKKININALNRHFDGATEKFSQACSDLDWNGIDSSLKYILPLIHDIVIAEAAMGLTVYSPVDIDEILSNTLEPIQIIALIQSLEMAHQRRIFQVAINSENWPLKFLAFRLSISSANPKIIESFEEEWETLLNQAALNEVEWLKWLAVFNSYPSRYPRLQRSMGKALCIMSAASIRHYFRALKLSTASRRTDLWETFTVVSLHSNEDQRKLVWTLAYERWIDWQFNDEISHSFNDIQTSSLDLALVFYFRTNLSGEEMEIHLDKLKNDYLIIQQEWHESIISYRHKLNLHLSSYQPLGQSIERNLSDEAWKAETDYHYPSWANPNSYFMLKNPAY